MAFGQILGLGGRIRSAELDREPGSSLPWAPTPPLHEVASGRSPALLNDPGGCGGDADNDGGPLLSMGPH